MSRPTASSGRVYASSESAQPANRIWDPVLLDHCLKPSAVVQVGAFNHKRRVSAVPIEAARVEDRMGDGNTEVAARLEHTGGFNNRAGHVVEVHQRVVDETRSNAASSKGSAVAFACR
jgi:hypothetical protein